MNGQINLDSKLGKIIYDFVKSDDIINIVEIGTWNGHGSTKCIKQSIIENDKREYYVYSLEVNPEMYKIANEEHKLKNFNLILGRIIEVEDLKWFNWDEYFNSPDGKHGNINKKDWLNEDIKYIKQTKNILHMIPETIDLLILDGGEFSTYPEYKKIGHSAKIIILDDSNEFKCKKIREELLLNDNYKILYDVPNDRNGFFIAEKIINNNF